MTKKLFIFDSLLKDEEAVGWCGKVLEIRENDFDVRLNGGILQVKRVMVEGGTKISAGEWAKTVNLQVGFRFK
jgi:methionyl-tRNA formyltransferase